VDLALVSVHGLGASGAHETLGRLSEGILLSFRVREFPIGVFRQLNLSSFQEDLVGRQVVVAAEFALEGRALVRERG